MNTNKQSFLKGFSKGILAPFSLFPEYRKPTVLNLVNLQNSKPLKAKRIKTGGIEADWLKIGGDMKRAMGYVATAVE